MINKNIIPFDAKYLNEPEIQVCLNNGFPINLKKTESEIYPFMAEIKSGRKLYVLNYDVNGKCFNADSSFDLCMASIEFKPESFDKVIAANENDYWKCEIYSHPIYIDNDIHKHICIGGQYDYVIPFEGNENLLGQLEELTKNL